MTVSTSIQSPTDDLLNAAQMQAQTQTANIKIADRLVGPTHAPFVIAELSGNHNGSLERALQLVDAAADSGVDALKLQTYTADTLTLDCDGPDFQIVNPESLWAGQTLYKLYQKAYTPWAWHGPIFERCQKLGLICFSTPFDVSAIELLESLNCPAYKIASFENIDLALIAAVAKTGKPVIISTGLASEEDITDAVTTAITHGCTQLALLKCTSSYPANPKNSNLLTLPYLQRKFGQLVAQLNPNAVLLTGLSDHTLGIGAAVASVALGGRIIEKHLTLDRDGGGVDDAFSLEPQEMMQLKLEADRAQQALGQIFMGPTEAEQQNLIFRRSLYISQPVKAGECLTEANVRSVRPGYGLKPKFLPQVLGQRAKRDLALGDRVTWDVIDR
ncbi:MAG: pseudaminic acid synthase [Vampirovibrionales bacterium]|nr:pseudaminic acid synthase [Vampirovibrionales bacterium]